MTRQLPRAPSRRRISRIAVGGVLLGAAAGACGFNKGTPGIGEPRPVVGSPASAAESLAVLQHARRISDGFVKLWRHRWEKSQAIHLSGERLATNAQLLREIWGPATPYPSDYFPPNELRRIAAQWRMSPDLKEGYVVLRRDLVHCHHGNAQSGPTGDRFPRVGAYIIESSVGVHAVCPSWFPEGVQLPWDERQGLDGALAEPLRSRTREARSQLLAELEWAARAIPGDGWISGQRLRFALDQGDMAAAERSVGECGSALWWCYALSGFLMHARGDARMAEATFMTMRRRMPDSVRCAWDDVRVLLQSRDREAYSRTSCAARDTLYERIWWLADPLLVEAGNERRAEHYARRVLLELRAATSYHERWDMRPEWGGDAIAEMLIRYGWPSYSGWLGAATDRRHYSYVEILAWEDQDHGRFTTAEYTAPRFHTFPSWNAIVSPGQEEAYDWEISLASNVVLNPTDTIWWPQEHYERRAGPLVQLWDQRVLLRRQDSVLFAMSNALLPEEFENAVGDTLRGFLFVGAAPDSMRAEPKGGIVGSSSVSRMMVKSRPQLVALELFGRRPRGVVARTRFGIDPPPPLAEMRAGELGISMPVLIRPAADTAVPISDERALSLMYSTAVFRGLTRLGVYWETYGLTPRDTVELAIRIDRHVPPPGVLRRIGFKLGIGQRQDGGVSVGWREPSPGRLVTTIPGRVPIQGRNITLDVSTLGPGDYTITVSVRRPGGTPITASRDFWFLRQGEGG